jgi:lambda family phage portal protein
MTGQVLAYYLVNPDDWKKAERVPASEIIHHFQFSRPGQIRGISFMASAVLTAKIVGQYINTELDGASMASKWLAFVTSNDIDLSQQNRVDADKLENIENAIIDYLRPGEQINFAAHNRPSGNFESFVKFVLRMISVAVGVPYDLLSGDSTDQNYTTLRSVRNDFSKDIEPHTERYRYHFCRPVSKDVFDQTVLYDKIKLPGYFQNPYRFQKARWLNSGMMPVDPFKEGKADIDGLSARTLSMQDVLAKRGKDMEEHLDEIEFYLAEMKKRGIESADVSTAIASNPATIIEEEKE